MSNIQNELQIIAELQSLEQQLSVSVRARLTLPVRIKELEDAFLKEKNKHLDSNKKMEEFDREKKLIEQLIKQDQDRIEKAKVKLTEITNNKEYQAALREIDNMKNSSHQLEDKLLTVMEQQDAISKQFSESEKNYLELESVYNAEVKKIQDKIEAQQSYETEIGQKRDEVIKNLSETTLKRYLRLKSRLPVPVAMVNDELCMGCNVNLPPQLCNQIRSATDIYECPNCHRILYFKVEEPVTEQQAQ